MQQAKKRKNIKRTSKPITNIKRAIRNLYFLTIRNVSSASFHVGVHSCVRRQNKNASDRKWENIICQPAMTLTSALLFIVYLTEAAAQDSAGTNFAGLTAQNICQLLPDSGPCRGSIQRWYYNSRILQCAQFSYGGCEGNENNFESKQECEQRCALAAMDACAQPVDSGPCMASVQMWYFNQRTGQCETFIYGGCHGNMNKFDGKEQCELQCKKDAGAQRVCLLRKETGPCRASFTKWYFDARTRKCEQFVYGGCGGNLNNFDSKQQCETKCLEEIKSYGICGEPMTAGPCNAAIQRWYFSLETQQCERFFYGGCQGNANNFESRQDCERKCLHKENTGDVCRQPMDIGPCKAAIPRWYFNSHTRTCEQFTYGGCEGNMNNFESREDCQGRCMRQLQSHGICGQPKEAGPCLAYIQRWYYDVERANCEPFIYGGCQGNMNNFETEQSCRERCSQEISCNLPKEVGPCAAAFTKWYYNRDSKRCETFTYGGCEGNANRFDSQEACMQQCVGYLPVDSRCRLPMETGPCTASFFRWFYNNSTGRCETFTYGGCNGNENNFTTKEECEKTCANY